MNGLFPKEGCPGTLKITTNTASPGTHRILRLLDQLQESRVAVAWGERAQLESWLEACRVPRVPPPHSHPHFLSNLPLPSQRALLSLADKIHSWGPPRSLGSGSLGLLPEIFPNSLANPEARV